jgi:hypothetical protein
MLRYIVGDNKNIISTTSKTRLDSSVDQHERGSSDKEHCFSKALGQYTDC